MGCGTGIVVSADRSSSHSTLRDRLGSGIDVMEVEAYYLFNPGLKIGQIVKNADIVEIFKCGNMGGMRRSRTTNTLVIVSDYTTRF